MPEKSKARPSLITIDTRPDHPPTNYFESLVHLLKGNIGVGVFAMADAYRNGGVYVATALTVGLAVICVHCQHILVKCCEKVSADHGDPDDLVDYAETVELCFKTGPGRFQSWAEPMALIVDIFICITQFGFCCIYLVFISSNLQQIINSSFGVNIPLYLMLIAVWFPIWIACMITNLKALAPISLIANFLIFGSYASAMYFALKDGLPNAGEREKFTNFHQLPLSFATIVFCYEGIALVLPIQRVMKKPEDFGKLFGVLNVAMCIIVSMCLLSGIAGYLQWGEEVRGSITLNIGESVLAQCTKAAVSLGILFTYPIQLYVPVQVLISSVLDKFACNSRPLLCELIFRTVMTVVTLILAEVIPNIGLFISLLGALCSTALALIFPAIIDSLILYRSSPSKCMEAFVFTKNILILLIAICGMAVGTYMSIEEIVEFFVNDFGNK